MRKMIGPGQLLTLLLCALLLPAWGLRLDQVQAARGTPTPDIAPHALPDLVVRAMVVAPENGWSCGTTARLGVRATVENRGSSTAGAFVLEVNGARQSASAGLAAGQSRSLWFSGYSTGTNTARVDVTNLVAESNETNNTLAQRLPVPVPPACTPTPTGGTRTATPTPTGGTRTATPTPTPGGAQPWLTVEPSTVSVAPGQTVVVRANSNLSVVGYTLTVIDNSTGQEQDQSNPIFTPARPGTIMAGSGAVSWSLTAARPGGVTFRVNAYGEINDPACSCWHFVSVNTSSVPVTVTSGATNTPTPTGQGHFESFRATVVLAQVELAVGQTLDVNATIYNESINVMLGLLQYRLRIETAPGVEQDQTSPIFTPARPEPIRHNLGINPNQSDSATFTLQAARPGSVTFLLTVSGEACYTGYPGCAGAHWASAGARSVTVVVR